MAVNIVTGLTGKSHVTSAQDGRKNAFAFGTGRYVFDSGSKFAYELVSNNLIKILDGDLIDQGRHICTEPNDYTELIIDNGISGNNRKDLIVMRYQKNEDTSIESASLVVIKGTSTAGTAVDPEYTDGDILAGDLTDDFLLYRVNISGLSITSVDKLFDVIPVGGIHGIVEQLGEMSNNLKNHIHDDRYYTKEESDHTTITNNQTFTRMIDSNSSSIANNAKKIQENKASIDSINSSLERFDQKIKTNGKDIHDAVTMINNQSADIKALKYEVSNLEQIYVGQCSLEYSLEKHSGKTWSYSQNTLLNKFDLVSKAYIIGVIGTNSGNGWVNVQEADITADGTLLIKLFNNATVTKTATANIKLLFLDKPRTVKAATFS